MKKTAALSLVNQPDFCILASTSGLIIYVICWAVFFFFHFRALNCWLWKKHSPCNSRAPSVCQVYWHEARNRWFCMFPSNPLQLSLVPPKLASYAFILICLIQRNAASTYNILNEEGRVVAAALLPYGVTS